MEFSKRCPSNNYHLFLIIWLLLTWIAVEKIFSSSSGKQSFGSLSEQSYEPQGLNSQAAAEGARGRTSCNTRDGHFQVDEDAAENAWSQMKWVGQPAPCPVRGELLERLDDGNNFRRGFALRFSGNVEDRTHILPWLLGSKVDLNQSKRRVFLDLGSNTFSSSLEWFLRMYPCDFTEVHAFEVRSELLRLPKPFDEKKNTAVENPNSQRAKETPGIPGWMLKRIKVYNNLVSDKDDVNSDSVNITAFMKYRLNLTAEDVVIVKMDIDGSEWPILTSWLHDTEMPRIVDELFVEVHYKHESMYNFNWHRFSHSRNEAKRLLGDLRWKGFYAHFWP